MNRNRFLVELEKSLTFMESEDRDAALAYYNELFDEAGADNEQRILDELGNAVRVAVQLNREYAPEKPIPTGTELAVAGEEEPRTDGKTNTPWKGQVWRTGEAPPWRYGLDDLAGAATQTAPEEDKPEEPKPEEPNGEYAHAYKSAEEPKQSTWHSPLPQQETQKQGRPQQEDSTEHKTEQPNGDAHQNPFAYNPDPAQEKKRRLPGWAIALIAVFAIPVGIPLAVTVFSLFIAILAVMVALVASGVGVTLGGIGLIISGIWALGFVPDALMMFGVGAIVMAVGLILTWFMVWLCALVFKSLFRRLRRRKGGKTA